MRQRIIALLAIGAMLAMTVPGAPTASADAQLDCEGQTMQDPHNGKYSREGWIQTQRLLEPSLSRQLTYSYLERSLSIVPLSDVQAGATNGIDAWVTCVPDNFTANIDVCLAEEERNQDDLIRDGYKLNENDPQMHIGFINAQGATTDKPIPMGDECTQFRDVPSGFGEIEYVYVFASSAEPRGAQLRFLDGTGIYSANFQFTACAPLACS